MKHKENTVRVAGAQTAIEHSMRSLAQRKYLILSTGRWELRRVSPSRQKTLDWRVGGGTIPNGICGLSATPFLSVVLTLPLGG